jgi:hypothetical protein
MLETLSGLFSSLRQSTPALLAGIALSCAILLFTPEVIISALGLFEFRETYHSFLGGGLVVSGSVLFAHGIARLAASARGCIARWQAGRQHARRIEAGKRALLSLTPDEKAYLVPYIVHEETTCYYQLEDGVVGSLEAKGIIYRASNVGRALTGFAYNLQPWARDHLIANPKLLEGARQKPTGPPRVW